MTASIDLKTGLRAKPNYNELIGYLLNNQEKLKLPNRIAKFIANDPKVLNLLSLADEDGMTIKDVEEQQIKQMKEQEKEHIIRQAGGSAQVRRAMDQKTQTDNIKSTAFATQTINPKTTSTGSQAFKPERKSGGYQTDGAQYFDMALEDKVADVNEQIEMELDKHDSNQEQQSANILSILESHLGEVTQQQSDFVHQLIQPDSGTASSSGLGGASPSTAIARVRKTTTKQSKDPETDVEPKGKPGRPKKDTDARMEQLEQQSTPEKRERKESNGNGNKPPKAKRKTKRERELEQLALEQERKYSPETAQPSASAEPSSPKVKKTIEKPKQISPSQIGIQKVREEVEQAKLAGKLNTQDTSAYMILYDEWKAAKGNQKVKKEKLNALREIYKRVVYKK